MFRVGADDPDHAFAVDHFALVADFLYRCANFHVSLTAGSDACATVSWLSVPCPDRAGSIPLRPGRPEPAGRNCVSHCPPSGPKPSDRKSTRLNSSHGYISYAD